MIAAAIDAIRHGAEAGKLRAYVRENKGGCSGSLASLAELAERQSRVSTSYVCLLARGWPPQPSPDNMASESEL